MFNAATAVVGDEIILLLRVAERPRSDVDLPAGALTLDFSGPHPIRKALPHGYTKDDVIGIALPPAGSSVLHSSLPLSTSKARRR